MIIKNSMAGPTPVGGVWDWDTIRWSLATRHWGPEDLTLGIAVILGFTLAAAIPYFKQNRERLEGMKRDSQKTVKRILNKKSFTDLEKDLFEEMTHSHLFTHRVLTDRNTFNRQAKKVKEDSFTAFDQMEAAKDKGLIKLSILGSMRQKVGFHRAWYFHDLTTTHEIPIHTGVIFHFKDGSRSKGYLSKQTEKFFTVMPSERLFLKKNNQVKISFKLPTHGIHEATCFVLSTHADSFSFLHTDEVVKRKQSTT